MSKIKKKLTTVALALLAVVVIFSAAIILVPLALNQTPLKEQLDQKIGEAIGGDFAYQSLRISAFPNLHLMLDNPHVTISHQISATADSLVLYPSLRQLLKGSFTLTRAELIQPHVTLWRDKPSGVTPPEEKQVALAETLQRVLQIIPTQLRLQHTVQQAEITQGRLTVRHRHGALLVVRNIDGSLISANNKVTVDLTAEADMWEKFHIRGSIDTHQNRPKLSLDLSVNKLLLDRVGQALMPSGSLKIVQGKADLQVDLEVDHQNKLLVKFSGTAPNLRLTRNGHTGLVDVDKITGSIAATTTSASVAVTEFTLGAPRLSASGSMHFSEKSPRLTVKLEGREIDTEAVSSLTQALFEEVSVLQTIFEIVKRGTIDSITLASNVDDTAGLMDIHNLLLQAGITGGQIDIPGANLTLTDVGGEVTLIDGILRGDNVTGRWQSSHVVEGNFSIGLSKNPINLKVATEVKVDAKDVPDLLFKFITNDAFHEQLKKVKDLKGTVGGTVELGGDIERLTVKVAANELDLSGHYNQIPMPLHLNGGSLVYDEERLQWERLQGSLGASSFSAVSGSLCFDEDKTFAITSGNSKVIIPNLVPWLASLEKTRKLAGYYENGRGILYLSAIEADGSLKEPEKTNFKISGEIDDLILQGLTATPGPVTLASLKFTVVPELFTFSSADIRLLDGALNGSGTYQGYQSSQERALNSRFRGSLGADLAKWAAGQLHVPLGFQVLPISIRDAQLGYRQGTSAAISATLSLQKDLEVEAEVKLTPDSINLEVLQIKDSQSQASISGAKKDHLINMKFSGDLYGSTLEKVIRLSTHRDHLQDGLLRGDASLSIDLDQPMASTLTGMLETERLTISAPEAPLLISALKLTGEHNKLSIESGSLSWDGIPLSVDGTLVPSAASPVQISLNIETETIDVNKIMRGIASVPASGQLKLDSLPRELPFRGLVRLNTDNFTADNLTVQPLHSEIRLNSHSVDIDLLVAKLCQISISGNLTLRDKKLKFHLMPSAQEVTLDKSLGCFLDKHVKIDGTLDMSGTVSGVGAKNELLGSAAGQLQFDISDGHIYRDFIIFNILKFLNVAEVFDRKISAGEMFQKGVGFKHIGGHLKLKDGNIIVEALALEADEIILSGEGNIDVTKNVIDFNILVSTQATLNRLLGHVPLIGGILNTATAIPLRISGKLDDVHVLPLAPSAVGHKLQSLLQQVAGVPLSLIHLDDYHESGDDNN